MIDPTTLPYRDNVGAVLFNADGRVFIGRRANLPAGAPNLGTWQFPQGGIDAGENPRTAVMRELTEEIGTARAEVMAEHEDWLTYDLPPELLGKVWSGKYRGQRQRWFALRFTGVDADIRLDAHDEVEFDAWRWAALAEVPALVVAFKRPVYAVLARVFAGFAGGN